MNLLLIAAAAAQTFNLDCSGTIKTESITGQKVEPYEYIYRIDLTKGVYCDDQCKGMHPIASIQPTAIRLEDNHTDKLDEMETLTNEINRETGKQSILSLSNTRLLGRMITKWDGQCEAKPFTGFPTLQTKF